MEFLKIQSLSKIFTTEEIETIALNNISFEVSKGQFVAVMGPSGCGKSTLLNIIGLLDNLSSGTYSFLGKDISNYRLYDKAELRKTHIGFIFQNFNLINELNVYDNIELPLIYSGCKKAERKSRVEYALEKLQIYNRISHFPNQLSGGQQQRVAIARAIVTKPSLLLADEPTGNLDSKNSNEVMELLTTLNSEGTTIIMVTHSEGDAEYAQSRINLLDGRINFEK